jgi:hypothetical protein
MSKIEVNAVEPQSGTTLTLGASGDTVALAAGALQTGFGRTGTVDWSSTIRTSGFTAVSGVGYFCDTASAAFTVTLPASPSVGDIVAIKDWSSTAATNNITIGRNGQEIEGNTTDGVINVHGDAQTLVFSGASRGWMVVNSGLLEGIQGPQFVAATGGTVLTCGNFKTHVFTGPGSFVVSCGGNDIGSNSVEYMVVAGGGGGGGGGVVGAQGGAGGGGAGGFRQNYPSPTSAGLPVTATTYPISIGSGGTGGVDYATSSTQGTPSIFSTITSTGGGTGGNAYAFPPYAPAPVGDKVTGGSGGSGGGGGATDNPSYGNGGTGNTPPVSPSQGNSGGRGAPASYFAGGGGGGASAIGAAATPGGGAGSGGVGSSWTNPLFGPTAPSYGTAGPAPGDRYFAGGGGGGNTLSAPNGGSGGGGSGAPSPANGNGSAGASNTGGGGGGSANQTYTGGTGGSGIVLIRYKYQ